MDSQITSLSGIRLPVERRTAIMRRLVESGVVLTQDLVEDLHVSIETIRRDLAILEEESFLKRVRGGAVSIDQNQRLHEEPSYVDRSITQEAEKRRMGIVAAQMIHDDATIFLDIGTTVLHVAMALSADFHGIVVTNSLLAAMEAAKRPRATVLVTGGRVSRDDMAMGGQHASDLLEDVRADLAFLASGGVHPLAGLTDFYMEEVTIRRVMMRNSAKTYVMADSTKFNRIAPFHVADWDAFTGLITDQEPSPGFRAEITDGGGEIIVASE